jgi:hypothetical protein
MGKLDDALRMAVMPSGMGAVARCEHVLMREVMSCVIGDDGDEATRLETFTHAIQDMGEEDYRGKLRLPYVIATDIVPHALVEASEYDETASVEASWAVTRALRAIRDAEPERKAEAEAKARDHVCPATCSFPRAAAHAEAITWIGWLEDCETLGWSLEYVNQQLDHVYHGVRGEELHDHTCKLLLMSKAYKV